MVHMAGMDTSFPTPHAPGTAMAPIHASAEARDLLALRRSAGKQMLAAPGPSPDAVDALLTVAMRVPDHRRLEPWRFLVFEGEARHRLGDGLAEIYARQNPDAPAGDVDKMARTLPTRAPVVVAVIASPDTGHKTPVWEQTLSAGAVCFNLLLAANAAGWAGVWLTEWIAFDPEVATL
ncbi:MAG: nitroreductase, partial [Pseudomonadota bacterium]